jgi:transposase
MGRDQPLVRYLPADANQRTLPIAESWKSTDGYGSGVPVRSLREQPLAAVFAKASSKRAPRKPTRSAASWASSAGSCRQGSLTSPSAYRACLKTSNPLPGSFLQLITRLTEHLKDLDKLVGEFEAQIKAWHRSSELSMKLEKIPGIVPLGASALVASIADANSFANGRQLSAWLGLVPRQHSSGGKPALLGISKRGDLYLRTLLTHGARSAILAAQRKAVNTNVWLAGLLGRRHPNVAAVALANKNVRTVWALLAHGREFSPNYAAQLLAA